VGFDGSPEARAALGAARHLAARGGSAIKALFVLPLQSRPYGDPIAHRWPDVAQQIAEDDRHRFDDLESVDAEVRYGRPHEELERFSEALDLLIVGSRSQGALRRMVTGSTSNHLARRPRCPLLVLPRRATGAPNPAAPASLTTQRQNSPTP
jgi:nucleotide-binding universal stress UspA family protein